MVRKVGLEPTQSCDHKLLRLTRLPIPPLPHLEHISSRLFYYSRPGNTSKEAGRLQLPVRISSAERGTQNSDVPQAKNIIATIEKIKAPPKKAPSG